MTPSAPILADTCPASWALNNGGRHRTEQIHGILERAGILIAAVAQEQPCSNVRRYFLGLRYLLQTGLANGASLRLVRRYGGTVARVQDSLLRHSGQKILLWEISHPNNLAVAHLARSAGYSIIAVPHNLESFAPGNKPELPDVLARRMIAEIRALARADSVFCISREEQWLLSVCGIAAGYLPYFPPPEVEQFLLSIRARRSANGPPQRFLLLGSCGNPPSAAGMREQIRLLKSLPGGSSLPVDIAGSGAEILQPHVAGTGYRLHGSVDRPALADLLLQAKALLVYQRAAAGALTRIPEALLAGVPVIASPIAARSAVELPGVRVYSTALQLHEAMHQALAVPPPPQKPMHAEQCLVESLTRMMRADQPASRCQNRCATA